MGNAIAVVPVHKIPRAERQRHQTSRRRKARRARHPRTSSRTCLAPSARHPLKHHVSLRRQHTRVEGSPGRYMIPRSGSRTRIIRLIRRPTSTRRNSTVRIRRMSGTRVALLRIQQQGNTIVRPFGRMHHRLPRRTTRAIHFPRFLPRTRHVRINSRISFSRALSVSLLPWRSLWMGVRAVKIARVPDARYIPSQLLSRKTSRRGRARMARTE